MEELTGIALIGIIVGFLVVILWIFLPFAVFGIKPLLDKQNRILKSIEEHLKFQNDQIKKTHQEPRPKPKETGQAMKTLASF